jgi:hypothetical protein
MQGGDAAIVDTTAPSIQDSLYDASNETWARYRSPEALVPAAITVFTAGFYFAVFLSHQTNGPLNYLTDGLDAVICVTAGILALRQLIRYRRTASRPLLHMTATFCVAMGMYGVAGLVWLSFNLRGIAIPYPGLPDVFFVTSDIVSIIGIGLLFWALDTNVRDELGPFVDLLAVVWSLTIVVITLLGVSLQSTGDLVKLILDIVYPFLAALACALAGALVLGHQLRRLSALWRCFVVLVYLSWLFSFFSSIGFSITTSLGHNAADFKYFYYDGGPTDALNAISELLILWALAFIPLHASLQPAELGDVPRDAPRDYVAGHGQH